MLTEIVVKYIINIVRNQDIAEEIAQDVFIRLYNYGIENIKYIKPWLYKTSIYLSYNYLRTEKRHIRNKEKLFNYKEDYTNEAPEEIYIRKETEKEIKFILDKMSEEDKNILELKYKGFKYKEIANIMNINVNSVGKVLSRARKKFYILYEQNRR